MYYKMRYWTRETNDLTELLPRNTEQATCFSNGNTHRLFVQPCSDSSLVIIKCAFLFFSVRAQVNIKTYQPSKNEISFLGQALTSACIHVESFWLSPKIFVDEGEQNSLHFEYVDSYSCYNNTCLLLVLGSDATLPVNLQTGVILYIMRYENQHLEKKLCWPSNGHSKLHLFDNTA